MKLLIQGDDFGFTRGVTYGIRDAIDLGVLRNTGLFTNMPSAELAVSFMKDRPQVCFGVDFNIVSGPSVSDPKDIPHLVDSDGNFIRSGVRQRDPMFATEKGRRAMFPYDEVYRELKNQYNKFIEMTGRKPGYLHAHSLMHENYMEAIRAISKETGIPFSMDLMENLHAATEEFVGKSKVFDPEAQLASDPLKGFMANADQFLSHDYGWLCRHPGYVDDDLIQLTTLSLERMKDAAMYMSDELKNWIDQNNVELITYYDLYERNNAE
jgi:predicted glycoside hydrolase/deacetylase ChbG (UPF0249 family)